MFLRRLFYKIWSLLFPGYAAQKAQREKAEILAFEQHLFAGWKVKSAFPHLKVRRNDVSGMWTVWIKSRTDAYLVWSIVPHKAPPLTRYTMTQARTSVRMGKKRSLTLIEYLRPKRTTWNLSGTVKLLFARLTMQSGGQSKCLIAFYQDAASLSRMPPGQAADQK